MHSTIHWTMREWQLVEAKINDPSCNPSPRAVDTAQRLALPPHRWRPLTSLYGRHNRAHYRGEFALARMRNIEAGRLADHQRLLDAEAAQARMQARQEAMARELEEIKARVAAMPKPERHCEEEQHSTRTMRIDVVGLIGQQVTHVRKLLPDHIRHRVRFVLADEISSVRSPAPAAVIFVRFANHSAEDKYAGSNVIKVHTRSAGAAIPAIEQLLNEVKNG